MAKTPNSPYCLLQNSSASTRQQNGGPCQGGGGGGCYNCGHVVPLSGLSVPSLLCGQVGDATRSKPKCKACKKPMKGHKNVKDCPNTKKNKTLQTSCVVTTNCIVKFTQTTQFLWPRCPDTTFLYNKYNVSFIICTSMLLSLAV